MHLLLTYLLWHCWLGARKTMRWWGVGVVICLPQCADCLHMVQLMPLYPKSPSSLASFKSRLVLLFWYRLTQVVLEKRPLNGCVHVFSAHECLWLLEILPDPFGDPYVHFFSRCYCFTYFVFVCITAWWEFFFLIWRFTSCCYRNSFCRFSVWNKFPLQVVRLTGFGRKCNEGKINKTLLRIERSHWWWISVLRASLKLRPYGTIQHTYTCAFNGPFLGLPGWAGTRKVKPIRILLNKRQWVAVASAGLYASLHLAPDRKPRQHFTTEIFTGRMPFLPPNQQCQRTEGKWHYTNLFIIIIICCRVRYNSWYEDQQEEQQRQSFAGMHYCWYCYFASARGL